MLKLQRVTLDEVDWATADRRPDRVIFQTREWLAFLASTQEADPVVAEIRDGSSSLGYFTGAMIRRLGVKILGSPFPGWTTAYMAFNLDEGVTRTHALEAVSTFAFGSLGAWHLELRSRSFVPEDVRDLPFHHSRHPTFEIELSKSEDELWRDMSSACRRCIRKAEKVGVIIEEADDLGFADEYYDQLVDVFAKQSLRPTYGVERIRQLIRHIHPTGRLLLLRARDPEGTCIATGIFPAMNGVMYFWGGASWRKHQILRPNEALFWYAMRHWKRLGMTSFDLGGGGEYKRKYGPTEVMVTELMRSRYTGISQMRDLARTIRALDPSWRIRTAAGRLRAR